MLDPFAGGGAIPLEAMRLGCEATAIDINPVAWFILKCTLDYPRRSPARRFRCRISRAPTAPSWRRSSRPRGSRARLWPASSPRLGLGKDGGEAEPALLDDVLEGGSALLQADLAWQVRAWGRYVLARVRATLAERYPTYAEFQALAPGGRPYEERPLALLPPDERGETDAGPLNVRFDGAYLEDPRNPRWVSKPTVAYLWARTVRCKGCRATMPLLKTRWLCKKENKRVSAHDDAEGGRKTGVDFGVETDVPRSGGNAAQQREHDKRIGAGTMSRSGASCPCCPTIMTMEDIRLEGRAGRLGAVMTAVVVDGPKGKEYRLPEDEELPAAEVSSEEDRGALWRGSLRTAG